MTITLRDCRAFRIPLEAHSSAAAPDRAASSYRGDGRGQFRAYSMYLCLRQRGADRHVLGRRISVVVLGKH